MNPLPLPEYKDMLGNPIKAGDYIVYSAINYRSAEMRGAKVVELKVVEQKRWNDQTKTYDPYLEGKLSVYAAELGYVSAGIRGPRPMTRKASVSHLNNVLVVPRTSFTQDWLDAIDGTGKWL